MDIPQRDTPALDSISTRYERPADFPPRRRPVESPSKRQPHKSTWSNLADRIERQMQDDGHQTWGYVVYRTTYLSDNDWEEFLRRLQLAMEKSFDRCNGRDILDSFTLTVFSDRALFEAASHATIREHFRAWASEAYVVEQPKDSGDHDQALPRMGKSARYQLCIVVDEDALISVVHDPPAPPAHDASKTGRVKLINKSWTPAEDPHPPGYHSPYEEIDGLTKFDVGWMKVPYRRVMTEYYSGPEDMNGWRVEYCRPPQVLGAPYIPSRSVILTPGAGQ